MTAFYLSKPYEPPQAPQTLPLDLPWALLGQMSPQQFMKRYWHKKPLLVRGAIPAFDLAKANHEHLDSPISPESLFKIGEQVDVESRLIRSKPWGFVNGPFKKKAFPKLHEKDWTLLLQGMEAKHPAAAKVLSWFRFIPDARLDDLMISIAGVGGGVGPHFDSYDVFLIQMAGRRHWRISQQDDLRLTPGLPLKILKHFKSEQDWILEPGDMLYLPPHVAHDGIALDSGCQTWSVGFRAHSYKELLQEGLWHLAESLEGIPELQAHFADPKQAATHEPELLPAELIQQLSRQLKMLRLDQIEHFLPGIASFLSEPKAQAIFDGADANLTLNEFSHHLTRQALLLHPQTRIQSHKQQIFCNGENMTDQQSAPIQRAWKVLANKKAFMSQNRMPLDQKSSLFEAYEAGWLVFDQKAKS